MSASLTAKLNLEYQVRVKRKRGICTPSLFSPLLRGPWDLFSAEKVIIVSTFLLLPFLHVLILTSSSVLGDEYGP